MNIVEVCNKLVQKDRDVNAACIEAGMIPFLNRCLAEAMCGPFGSGKKDLLLFAVKALAKLAAGPPHHTAVSMYVCMNGWMDGWMDGWMCIHIVCMRVMFCSRTCSTHVHVLGPCTWRYLAHCDESVCGEALHLTGVCQGGVLDK